MSRSSKIVHQVLAAVDSPAIPYRTFPEDRTAGADPTQSIGSAFPLLAAAIPEISALPVRPARAEAALAQSEFVAEPPAVGGHSHLDRSSPIDLGRTLGTSETSAAVAELFQPAVPETRPPRRPATTLGAIFRMLGGQIEQPTQVSRRGLDDLFRRG